MKRRIASSSDGVRGYPYLRAIRHGLRLRGPLAGDPKAQILHAVLLAMLLWTVLNFAVEWHDSPRTAVGSALSVFLGLTIASAITFLRRGRLRAASLAYLSGSWIFCTTEIVLNGGIQSVGAVFYVALPISAAWLLGYGAALVTAAICLSSSLGMAVLEMNGVSLPIYFPGKPLGIWMAIVEALVIAAVPVAQVLQIFAKTLSSLRQHQEHLEDLVRQRTAELEAANRAKGVFLANMSHELRTPLNAILGFTAIVREDPGLSEAHRQDLDIVNSSGEHLLSLIDEVLDVAKIEAGRIVVENVPFDVNSLVRDAVRMMRVRAAEKGIDLLITASPNVPGFARSDGAKLRQVLVNLIGNAVKFTDRGSVTLCVDAKPRAAGDRTVLIFEIQDTGIGIFPEDQGRIFSPFVQVGKTGMQVGTGLGLTITRQLVQILGGTIHVESMPNVGTLFRVEIPVELAAESEIGAGNNPGRHTIVLAPGQPQYRILIVEDKRANWLLLKRLLEDSGFKVRVAEDAAKGIEVTQAWQPHLIWLDLHLPGMGGLAAAREIRSRKSGRNVKIVALTASAFSHQREDVLAAGLDDFVRKPYRREEIFNCIGRHLGVRFLPPETMASSPGDPDAALPVGALTALPAPLRKELANALVRLDSEPIAEAIARVAKHDARLAGTLTRLTKRLAYAQILNAIEDASQERAHGTAL